MSVLMTLHRNHLLTVSLCCLLLAGCASSLKPSNTYKRPAGAAPPEYNTVETGELGATTGLRDDGTGAEVISSETVGEEQSIEVTVPIEPDQVDEVRILSPSGEPVELSREAEIIHKYETNDVGIRFQVPKNNTNIRFQLQLMDTREDDWPPFRDQ